MKIGLIADIHSNLPALTAVLERLESVDMLICAGDMVGYYNQPNEVCESIRERAAAVVFGNHEAYVTGLWKPNLEYEPILRAVWTKDNLSPINFDWLSNLPEESIINVDSYTLRIRHTWKGGSYLYKDSPLLQDIKLESGKIVVIGHTHCQMNARCGDGFIINPGSVGQPRDLNPAASYAVFDSETGNVEFFRILYDVKSLQQKLLLLGWDENITGRLSLAWPANRSAN